MTTKDLEEFLHDPLNWCLVDELQREYVEEIITRLRAYDKLREKDDL